MSFAFKVILVFHSLKLSGKSNLFNFFYGDLAQGMIFESVSSPSFFFWLLDFYFDEKLFTYIFYAILSSFYH